MSIRKRLYFGLIAGLAGWAQGAEVDLEFTIGPSPSTTQMSLSTGGSHSRTIIYTGSLQATVSFDDETLEPQSIEFKSGRYYVTSSIHNLTSNITFTDLGTFLVTLTYEFENPSARIETINPPAAVAADGTLLEVEKHRSILDQGRFIQTVTILDVSESQIVDFSDVQEPSDFTGSAHLSISELSRTSSARRLQFILTSDNSTSDELPLEGSNARLRLEESGTMTAVGETYLLSDYGEWLQAIGGDPLDPGLPNPDGLPFPLLYAFDLPIDTKRLPIEIVNDGDVTVRVNLPLGGLNTGLIPEMSDSLAEGIWAPVPETEFLDGAASFDAGSIGMPRIRIPGTESTFVRFRLDL